MQKEERNMREELQCPVITKDGKIIGYGGDQEWFTKEFQRLAGAAALQEAIWRPFTLRQMRQ